MRWLLTRLAAPLLLSGCLGTIDDPPVVPEPTPDERCAAAELGPARAPLRRLNDEELRLAVRDLFGPEVAERVGLPRLRIPSTFATDPANLQSSPALVEQLLELAEAIAAVAVAPAVLSRFDPCGETALDDTCARRLLGAIAARAFRRPLAPGEAESLGETYRRGRDESTPGPAAGLRLAIERILLSPPFFTHAEGAALDPHQRAARISFALTGGPPDAPLRQAADRGALATPDEVRAQIERILAGDPEDGPAHRWLEGFHEQWLELDQLGPVHVAGDPALDLAPFFRNETRAYVNEIVWNRRGGAAELLDGGFAMLDDTLARHYGVTAPPFGSVPVPVESEHHIGLLTQGSFLARTATATGTSPVRRGVFALTRVACQEIPPPPPGVIDRLPSPPPDATQREILASHRSDPICSSCHARIDPAGLAFEDYDPYGRRRELEGVRPVDASGGAFGVEVIGGAEMSGLLASRPEVDACYRTMLFRYVFARAPTTAERCGLANLSARGTLALLTEMLVATTAAPEAGR